MDIRDFLPERGSRSSMPAHVSYFFPSSHVFALTPKLTELYMVSAPQTIGTVNYMQGIRRRRRSLLQSHDSMHAHLIEFRTV